MSNLEPPCPELKRKFGTSNLHARIYKSTLVMGRSGGPAKSVERGTKTTCGAKTKAGEPHATAFQTLATADVAVEAPVERR